VLPVWNKVLTFNRPVFLFIEREHLIVGAQNALACNDDAQGHKTANREKNAEW
jgi:hypothetical protein